MYLILLPSNMTMLHGVAVYVAQVKAFYVTDFEISVY
jgi:hypothetical protein